MSFDPGAIREAVKLTLDNLARTIPVYAHDPGGLTAPFIVLRDGRPFIDYHLSMGGQSEMRLTIEIRLASADVLSARVALDDFLSAGAGKDSSIIDTLYDAGSPLFAYYGQAQQTFKIEAVEPSFFDGPELVCQFDCIFYATRA